MDFFNIFIFSIIITSSIFTIYSINPIESLLFLIFNFLLASFLFLRLGAEFIALLLLIVYIGAIFILFIFIIMMLNLRLIFFYTNYYNYLFLILFLFLFFFFEICLFIYTENLQLNIFLYDFRYEPLFFFYKLLNFDNISLIGTVLFNFNFLLFIFLGIVLLIAMICVIVLVLNSEFSDDTQINKYKIIYIKKIYE